MTDESRLFARVEPYVSSRGIEVVRRRLPSDIPARFDGLSIHLNPTFDSTSLAFYLLHSFGSIVGWSLDRPRVQAIFDELRDAKATRDENFARLENALVPFRQFERASSEFSVWTLEELGLADQIEAFSDFFHADLEAITIFHRTGTLPVWKPFLIAWKRDIAEGLRQRERFQPRPIPLFRPVRIDVQEVQQRAES